MSTTEPVALARAVGELRGWLLAPGRIEAYLDVKHDTDGQRLEALKQDDNLAASLRSLGLGSRALAAHAPAPPSADDERAFLADLLDDLAEPRTTLAASAALPYLGRALRCYEDARKAEAESVEQFAWLVDDLREALGWAAEAQDTAVGDVALADFKAGQEGDALFGFFLGEPKPARHPAIFGGSERSRAFRWIRWARRLAERDYLSRAAKQIAYLLADFADYKTGECWPSQSMLAELSGMTKKGVREGIRELQRDLALVVEQEATGRGATRYRLLAIEVTPMAVNVARYGQEDEPEVPF